LRQQLSANSTFPAIDSRPPGAAAEKQLVVALWLTVVSLFVFLAAVLLVRRLSGALVQPLGGLALVALTAAAIAITAMLRSALTTEYLAPSTWYAAIPISHRWPIPLPLGEGGRRRRPGEGLQLVAILFAIPGVTSFLLLAALSIRGTSIGATLAWLLLLAAETGTWLLYYGKLPRLRPLGTPVQLAANHLPPLADESESVAEAEIPAGLIQQITRVREGDHESLHAFIQAQIPPGDRLAILHIAFCPPLQSPPELTAHALEAADVEVKITQAETFGARIEVRLAQPTRETKEILIEVLGQAALGV